MNIWREDLEQTASTINPERVYVISNHPDGFNGSSVSWRDVLGFRQYLPVGMRWLKHGEIMQKGDIGFDKYQHEIAESYIVGQPWTKSKWLPIARRIKT